MRELCRAHPHPGLHLFLPDAVSISLGQPDWHRHGGGRGRVHAGAHGGLAAGWRHRGNPRRIDRRLRLGATAQGARANLARTDRLRPQHPPLSPLWRYPAHGGAVGLCTTALFATPARRHRRRHGARLCDAAAPRSIRQRQRPRPRPVRLGADGNGLCAHATPLSGVVAVGMGVAGHRTVLHALYVRLRPPIRPRQRRVMEGAHPGERTMTEKPAALRSGKGPRDENFPVASRLIHPRHRGPILAFYEFVRTADDMADHATLTAQEKLDLLDQLEATFLGKNDDVPEGVRLRSALRERSLSPRHAQDLLTAFRMDVTKLRYRDWDDLMNYCTYSAMPVGRFVLDVHGEDRSCWPANDALCAALQIINHLQDCRADYRNLDRVYVPLDALAAAGAKIEDLGGERSPPALRECL